MEIKLHKNAKTTLKLREEIRASSESIYALSKKFSLNWGTIKRWKQSISLEDKSSRPYKLNTTLTTEQEELICFVRRILWKRKQFKKTIEEIFFTLESRVPNLYPMKIYPDLSGYGLGVLPSEFIDAEKRIKKFRHYGIGYLHIDLLYAPKMNSPRLKRRGIMSR